MNHIPKEIVIEVVQKAINSLASNPLGLKIAENGVREVDGRWWAVLDMSNEPRERSRVWEAVARVEEIIEEDPNEDSELRVLVTAS